MVVQSFKVSILPLTNAEICKIYQLEYFGVDAKYMLRLATA